MGGGAGVVPLGSDTRHCIPCMACEGEVDQLPPLFRRHRVLGIRLGRAHYRITEGEREPNDSAAEGRRMEAPSRRRVGLLIEQQKPVSLTLVTTRVPASLLSS